MTDRKILLESCEYDETRKLKPHYPLYRSQCRACAIASLAQSPFFHASGLDGVLAQPYRKALALVFGAEDAAIRNGHEAVKAKRSEFRAILRKQQTEEGNSQ